MATDLLEQKLAESVTCILCTGRLKKPKVLPCLHSFCLSCLESLPKKGDILECPTCREKHTLSKDGVAKLQTNFVLQNLAELLEVYEIKSTNLRCGSGLEDDNEPIGRCLQCEVYLCKPCLELHKKQVATRNHTIVMLDQIVSGGEATLHHPHSCPVHGKEEIKLYCRTCSRAICRDCTLVEHRDHDFAFIKNEAPEIGKRIARAHAVFSEKEKEYRDHVTYVDKVLKDNADQHTNNTARITFVFDGCAKELETQRRALLATLKGHVEEKEKQIKGEMEKLQLELTKLSGGVQFCQQLMNSGSDVQKAQMDFQVTDRLNSLKDLKWDRGAVFLTEWGLEGEGLDSFSRSQTIVSSTGSKASSFIIEGGSAHCGVLGHCQFVVKLKEDAKPPFPPAMDFSVAVQLTAKVGDDMEEGMVTLPYTIKRVGLRRWAVSYFVKVRGRCEVSVTLRSQHVTGSPFVSEIQKLSVGTCVQRGPSWKWGDQDGNGYGVVVDLDQMRKWVTVRWDTTHINGYRWGADAAYDLQPVESRK